jgi:hypothetical protein
LSALAVLLQAWGGPVGSGNSRIPYFLTTAQDGGKDKAVPLQSSGGPEGSRKLRSPDFLTTAQDGGKGKAVPLQSSGGPDGSRKLRFPDFLTTAQNGGKVVGLTHRPHLPPGNTPGTHFCQRLSRPQGRSAMKRIYVNEKFHDTIWDRTSDLLICSAVP